MHLFLFLLAKIVPLYAIILLGFLAGKLLAASRQTIASLLIYIIAPVVVFLGVVTTPISVSTLSLPLLFFVLCCLLCLVFYFIASLFWKDSTKNILAFAAGTGNTGYFGIPVALVIFKQDVLGLIVLSILGLIVFENSLGFFITAKGSHTTKEALMRVAKLPAIYAFVLALLVHVLHLNLGPSFFEIAQNFKGAYSVLGMMLIGLGVSGLSELKVEWPFTLFAFFAKFIAWPAVMFLIIFLDRHFLHLYNPLTYNVLLLLSIVPLAANSVAYATELKVHPEKTAVAVLLSTLFALFYIPIFVTLFFH